MKPKKARTIIKIINYTFLLLFSILGILVLLMSILYVIAPSKYYYLSNTIDNATLECPDYKGECYFRWRTIDFIEKKYFISGISTTPLTLFYIGDYCFRLIPPNLTIEYSMKYENLKHYAHYQTKLLGFLRNNDCFGYYN